MSGRCLANLKTSSLQKLSKSQTPLQNATLTRLPRVRFHNSCFYLHLSPYFKSKFQESRHLFAFDLPFFWFAIVDPWS